MIDETGAQREAAIDRCIRKVNAAARNDAAQHSHIVLRPVTETNRAQRNRRRELQGRLRLDLPRQELGMAEVLRDGFAEGAAAVILQRQPELQRAETPRELDRFVEERKPLRGVLVQ